MLLDDSLYCRQAYSGTLEIFSPVKSLKDSEQLVGVLHAEADTVIADKDGGISIVLDLSDLDDSKRARARVLERVGDQVLKYLLKQRGITFGEWQVGNFPLRSPAARWQRLL